VELEELEVYKISRELSRIVWPAYEGMNGTIKHLIGNQTLRAVDSIGANIAEGFGRYHYLDSVKFYYNARGSLWESSHWTELLHEIQFITEQRYTQLTERLEILGKKLNGFINSIKKRTQSR